MSKNESIAFKIAGLGDNEVGITSLIRRIMQERFVENYKPTLGADFWIKELDFDGIRIALYIWDIASQQSFKILRPYYLHGANGLLIMFDLTRPDSLDNVHQWLSEAREVVPRARCILVGTKLDLVRAGRRGIPKEALDRMARDTGFKILLTSAKTGEGCGDVTHEIVKLLIPRETAVKMPS